MELRVLGPVEAVVDGRVIDLGAPRQRCVLAILALEPNRVIPTERLIDAIWDTAAPAAAKSSIQAYISRLRRVFADVDSVSLTTRTGGYRLDIAAESIDLHRFRLLITKAKESADPAAAGEFFRQALDLWRGESLSDVRTTWLADRVCAGLEQERLDALEDHFDCRLALGAHADIVSALRGLVAEHPLREKLTCQLMLALYRNGQRASALEVYHCAAEHIAEELGLDPGAELQRMHEAVLRDESWLTVPPPTDLASPTPAPDEARTPIRPAQLPGDIAAFTGRDAELARLDTRHGPASDPRRHGTAGMRITAITGTAGVGKTSLALHWGHRAASLFPDGTLYLNLRGFDDQQPPMEPTEALRQLLGGLGVPMNQIPAELDERASLFRSILADRQVLVLLDNARGSKQVRPLLPGSASCQVLVTSRTRLDGLVALDGAQQVSLDSLAPTESVDLLSALLGAERVAAEAADAAQLAELCGHLPLGLRLAGAQLAGATRRTIGQFVEELADYQSRLDTLDLLDLDTPLRATFDVSYEALGADAARVFRIIGLHPGPDLTPEVIAAAAGTPPPRVRRWLAELTTAHLVSEHSPGRFSMHDLLRAYALEKANELPLDEQDRATETMLDFYLHVAQQGKARQYAGQKLSSVGVRHVPAHPPRFTTGSDATAWFDRERMNLIAAVRHAAGRDDTRHAYLIPLAMAMYFESHHRWDDAVTIGQIGLVCAQKKGDRTQEIRVLNLLGCASGLLHDRDAAIAHFQRMHELAVAENDRYLAGLALSNEANALLTSPNQVRDGIETGNRALAFISRTDDPWNWANTRNNICVGYLRLGEPAAALDHGKAALDIFTELKDESRQGKVWESLGQAYLELSRFDEARDCLHRTVQLSERSGNERTKANALVALGDLAKALDRPGEAVPYWQEAMALHDKLDTAVADRLRALIGQGHDGQPSGSPARQQHGSRRPERQGFGGDQELSPA